MKRKKIQTILLASLVVVASLGLFANIFFEQDIPTDARSAKLLFQDYFHGRVVNNTDHSIRITDYRNTHIIPPGQNSSHVGIYDVDSLLIDRPTQIDNILYTSGVFKFCDFGALEIRTEGAHDVVILNRVGTACRLLGDYAHFNKIPEAFPDRRAFMDS